MFTHLHSALAVSASSAAIPWWHGSRQNHGICFIWLFQQNHLCVSPSLSRWSSFCDVSEHCDSPVCWCIYSLYLVLSRWSADLKHSMDSSSSSRSQSSCCLISIAPWLHRLSLIGFESNSTFSCFHYGLKIPLALRTAVSFSLVICCLDDHILSFWPSNSFVNSRMTRPRKNLNSATELSLILFWRFFEMSIYIFYVPVGHSPMYSLTVLDDETHYDDWVWWFGRSSWCLRMDPN